MAFVEWTVDLNTGIAEIDKQHQELVARINDFAAAFKEGSRADAQAALQNLLDCTLAHFRYEEEMLEQAQYPLLEPHKKVHQNFLTKIDAARGRYENGYDEAAEELLNLLDGWLFRHIRLNDHGYVDSVKKAGIA